MAEHDTINKHITLNMYNNTNKFLEKKSALNKSRQHEMTKFTVNNKSK